MISSYASSWTESMQGSTTPVARNFARRTAHGGTAWGARPEIEMRQPQDGGLDLDTRSRVAQITAHLNRTSFQEPEDARITGTTRSLMRRLMGLNVLSRKAQKAATPLHGLLAHKQPQVA